VNHTIRKITPRSVCKVSSGIALLIDKRARAAATWLGLMTLLAVVIVYVPIVVAKPGDIGNAFNFLVGTLLLTGTLLALPGLSSNSPD
jgi:hypothetical protein